MIFRLSLWLWYRCCGMCEGIMWPWQRTYTLFDKTRQHTACRVAFNSRRDALYGDAVRPIDT